MTDDMIPRAKTIEAMRVEARMQSHPAVLWALDRAIDRVRDIPAQPSQAQPAARIAELEAEVSRLSFDNMVKAIQIKMHSRMAEEIRQQRDAAWNDGRDAAAEKIEAMWASTSAEHIAAIRALKRDKL